MEKNKMLGIGLAALLLLLIASPFAVANQAGAEKMTNMKDQITHLH